MNRWKFWEWKPPTVIRKQVNKKGFDELETTITDVDWSANPGCFERHLQRRSGNPLFPPEFRTVTKDELNEAKATDMAGANTFRKDCIEFLKSVRDAEDIVSASTALDGYKKAKELLHRAAQVGGDLTKLENGLRQLSDAIAKTVESSSNPELIASFQEFVNTKLERDRFLNNRFIAQLTRKDTPIKEIEIVPTLLSEDAETIELTLGFIGDDRQLLEQIHREASRLLREVADSDRSAPQQGIKDKLRIISEQIQRISATRPSLAQRRRDLQIPHGAAKDPAFLGDFLVLQVLGDRFGVDTAELVQNLRIDLRQKVQIWAGLYLAWVFQRLVSARYGNDFSETMMEAVNNRLRKLECLEPERGDLVKSLEFWFQRLDAATAHAGSKIGDVEVPLDYFAALAFLALDEGSPYHLEKEIHDGTDFDVARALADARAKAVHRIQVWLDIGGPLQSSAT